MNTYFIFGHLDLAEQEFTKYYKPKIDKVLLETPEAYFIIGDCLGTDFLAQKYLYGKTNNVIICHMFDKPYHNIGFRNADDRDAYMTYNSENDIWYERHEKRAWLRDIYKPNYINNINKNLIRRDTKNMNRIYATL